MMSQNDANEKVETQPEQVLGRNEPCPCGSKKKYKRCCGVSAAPKLSESKGSSSPLFDPSAMEGFNPEMMGQISQAFQRLPKGQLQRLQSLMQKAMSGKDITTEAREFERTLPPDFQDLMKTWGGMAAGSMGQGTPDLASLANTAESAPAQLPAPASEMTPEQARELVAKAAAEGKISQDVAEGLLKPSETPQAEAQNPASTGSKLSRFWKFKK